MQKEILSAAQNEDSKYYGEIPPEILENMSSEVRRQYFLWDEMLKRQIQLYPEMLLPLIKEIFQKDYPTGTNTKMLSTEYVVSKVYKHGEKRIESVRSDLLLQVGNKDIYHMECQMNQGGDIAIRMLEYDMNIALVHGLEWVEIPQGDKTYKYKLKFPKSAILYLDHTQKAPDSESCIIIFPDETEYEYHIPILKIQEYTPEMIEERNLNILLPFFPIRFKRRFETIQKARNDPHQFETACEKMKALKKDLTKLVSDCIIIVNREEENGTLSSIAGADIVELMGKACDYLFNKEPELLREVHEIMEPAIKLFSEELKEQKDTEFKLFSEKLNEQKEAEFKLFSEKWNEQKDTEFKLFSKKLNEQKDTEFKLFSEKLNEQKEAEFKLFSEKWNEQKDTEFKLFSKKLNEQKDTEFKLFSEKLNEQKEAEFKLFSEKLNEQKEAEFKQHIRNCILQCQSEGKNKLQTAQMLQAIFSLSSKDAKEILENF